MKVSQFVKVLKRCPSNYRVGIVIKRPDGDDFYEVEASDIELSFDTVEGDELPFGIVSLGTFNGDVAEEDGEDEDVQVQVQSQED